MQDILAGQLTDSDAAAVEAEFEELEAQALAAEVAGMPKVPDTPQTTVGQQVGTSAQTAAAAAAAEAEELPSVPTTKVRGCTVRAVVMTVVGGKQLYGRTSVQDPGTARGHSSCTELIKSNSKTTAARKRHTVRCGFQLLPNCGGVSVDTPSQQGSLHALLCVDAGSAWLRCLQVEATQPAAAAVEEEEPQRAAPLLAS